MIKKNLQQNKKGFTIIEFSISLIFISIILVAVCMLTIQISQIYQKGLVIRAINSTGREIMVLITLRMSRFSMLERSISFTTRKVVIKANKPLVSSVPVAMITYGILLIRLKTKIRIMPYW